MTWLFCIFPLLTVCQKDDLSHFYFTCLKGTTGVLYWNDLLFSITYDKKIARRSVAITIGGNIYGKALNNLTDGFLLSELSVHNFHRSQWLMKNIAKKYIYRS
jgi:hypothetical protein